MPSVSNLKLKLQTGSDNTYFASWDFKETYKNTTTSSTFKAGDLVSIKAGATYYNGSHIPDWVKGQRWYLMQVKGDRAVLGDNESRTNNIESPINVVNITGGSGGGGVVTTNTLDHYTVSWSYDTGDAIWFSGGSSDVKVKNATYSPPNNAIRVKVSVKPVSKTYKVNDTDTSYWTGSTVSKEYVVSNNPPEVPSVPTVTVDKYKLTASLENISDPRTDQIQFEVYNGTKVIKTGTITVLTMRASFSCTVEAGGDYRVRCRAINLNNNSKVYSAWSNFSSSIGTIPSTPAGITVCRASSETSVHLEWSSVNSADTYDIEYTTKLEYFDGSDQTTTITGIEFTHYEKTGLESGDEYFFRVRAVNDKGSSGWTDPKSVIIGKKPAAPTTWSSTTTAITGEPLTLYWVHNAEDGSNETYAELELYIDGLPKETHTIKNEDSEEDENRTRSYPIDTSEYVEGTTIQWRVRTAGITLQYGDWSIQRVVDIYAPATLELEVRNAEGTPIEVITTFPFYVSGLAGPKTQEPIGYHLTIKSNEIYNTVDQIGNPKIVNAGEEVYSKYFDTSDALLVELSAGNIDLENGVSYTVSCLVSMNSGLTALETTEISVQWTDMEYEPDIEIAVDTDAYSAYVRPYCVDVDGVPIADVTLSVYRREFDGEFTELASDIDPFMNTYITDPHPALDYARYRVVATSKTTGAISYYDAPGYPVGGKAVIIQWDEDWSDFNATGEAELAQPPWSGSMLKLPYNIDVSDKNSIDVSLIKYIGRKRPVSYYGTQLGETSSWKVEIEKDDEETLYALRRLAIWTGDVYVREPSGSGYWANIAVSFSQTHRQLTIPVTLDITRVEGGI